MAERIDAQAYKTLQRTLLERGGFSPQQVDVAAGRFSAMSAGSFRTLVEHHNLIETALFIYTLTGAKPATTINDAEGSLIPIATALDMPSLNYLADQSDQKLWGGCTVQHFEPWLLGHDAQTFAAFKNAIRAKDAVHIGEALGYPDPSKHIFNFPDINEAVHAQHKAGRRFIESMLYLEPVCIHSISEHVEQAGRLRKASLLAYECEVAGRGIQPDWYVPNKIARIMASHATIKWKKQAAQQNIHDPIPQPELLPLEELLAAPTKINSVLGLSAT